MKIKKIKILVGIIILLLTYSCQNEPNTFDDFDYTTTYFAWQYPIRTLVLGSESYYDNSNDLKHQFEIKASMGGVYTNMKNINAEFEIDPSLTDSLAFNNGTSNIRLRMLPSNYYEPISTNNLVIPAGSFNGGFVVKLTDAFFNDPLSCTNYYVLPLRIKTATTDSILKGKVSNSSPISSIPSIAGKWGVDPRIAANWIIKPRNFTIYAVKFVNKYHGFYLRRGTEKEASGVIKGYGLEKGYIEYTNYIPKLSTLSLTKLLYNDKLAVSSVKFKAILEVTSDKVIISTDPTSTTNVTGTGKYVVGFEQWGGKKRDAFYLDYTVSDPTNNKVYTVKDTLVIRDNAVSVEEFIPVIL